MKKIYFLFLLTLWASTLSCQFPWQRPLKIAWSNDGTSFGSSNIFQDSSGVPSVIRWRGDTLVCAFQWFRMPNPSPFWDRVAVKFSYNNGVSWTQPTPIIINGLTSDYQRPFDPTLVKIGKDSLRVYFSSSHVKTIGLDSTINTYSAISVDGINYTFETNARVDEIHNRVIDPAVILYKNAFHYLSPIGSPQQGAYHYVSPDGLNFTKVIDIPSSNNYNWTGNYMINDSNELRFYGSMGNGIWFNSTSNGGVWNGYNNTNIQGGDPSVLKVSLNNYLMVYVGNPYSSSIHLEFDKEDNILIFPNPTQGLINIKADIALLGKNYSVYDNTGKLVFMDKLKAENNIINFENFSEGIYTLIIEQKIKQTFKVIKK